MEHVYLEYMGNSFALPMGESVLGRDAGCVLRINDPAVSRRHARLIRRQNEVFVEDLDSANGTLINGRTITAPLRLRHGDVITVGPRELKVSFADRDEDESTVRIAVLVKAATQPQRHFTGRRTTELPAITPALLTADERCPRCSAVCSVDDELCGNCSFRFGSEPRAAGASLNRRRHDRYSVELGVAYASEHQQFDAATLDISENGVFVCSQNLDAVGTPCTLTLLLDGAELTVGGIVRRVAGSDTTHPELVGLGIELTKVGAPERQLLAALVTRLANTES